MSTLKDNFQGALREAVRRAGSQAELARAAGMQQGRISDYLTGRYAFENITVGTLQRLFPELAILYFAESSPTHDEVEQEMEKRIVQHFRLLGPADKARYMMLVAANFPEQMLKETEE